MSVATSVYLSPDTSLKRLESSYVYQRATDDLYEVTDTAFAFLERCRDGGPVDGAEQDFLSECLEERILQEDAPARRRGAAVAEAERPSLRYLLVHLTRRCNLACAHCYQGEARAADLPLATFAPLLEEFEAGGGLRLLLSGGEPLLHPGFWGINELLPAYDVRVVLLTNGTLIDAETARRLNVHEVQVSLDGMQESHDRLRGEGSFDTALAGLHAARDAGLAVSVATTVNAWNAGGFDDLERLVDGLDVWQWTIDVPAIAGRMAGRPELAADAVEAVRVLERARPAGNHGDNDGNLCGAHLAAVTPEGEVVKCGLLPDIVGGSAADGLRAAWRELPHFTTARLDEPCASCAALAECRGGCRYRAGGMPSTGPDPVQCHRYGVL